VQSQPGCAIRSPTPTASVTTPTPNTAPQRLLSDPSGRTTQPYPPPLAPNARNAPLGTVTEVPRRNPIDQRRTLTPRDYLTDPAHFGSPGPVTFHTPPDGDDASRHVAQGLHALAVALRTANINGAQTARNVNVSRQTFSDLLTGRHWPAMTTVIAAITALNPATQPR
jgi:hypothetical protein